MMEMQTGFLQRPSNRWRWVAVFACGMSATAGLLLASDKKEPVRVELDRMQRTQGLSLAVSLGGVGSDEIEVVSFKDRTTLRVIVLKERLTWGYAIFSWDGKQIASPVQIGSEDRYIDVLGIIGPDGTILRKYTNVRSPSDISWSQDGTRITVDAVTEGSQGTLRGLQILELNSGQVQPVEEKASAYEPAWSPSGGQIVYESSGMVRIYDLKEKRVRDLVKGKKPTWSPDGKWIAYWGEGKYYLISPSGSGKKSLFRAKRAITPLWWSPDSRFVAYASRASFFEEVNFPFFWKIDIIEEMRLRVRRLEDQEEDWVLRYSGKGPSEFQWVKNLDLFRQAEKPSR